MTLEERLEQCTKREIIELFDNAEELRSTGILPMDAPLRKLSQDVYYLSLVSHSHMTMVSYAIYRSIAIPAAKHIKSLLNGAGSLICIWNLPLFV